MTVDTANLGSAIKHVRSLRGLTQVQLAAATGLSKSGNSIALIEQGRRSVSLETLDAIATALEIPSGCLVIMGSKSSNASPAAKDLLGSVQELISNVLEAQQSAGGGTVQQRPKTAVKIQSSVAQDTTKSKPKRRIREVA